VHEPACPHAIDAFELRHDTGGSPEPISATSGTAEGVPMTLELVVSDLANGGVFGVDAGTPIINRPECAILATGLIAPRPWVVDGQLAVRQLMTTSVSFDHRIVDGAYAAQFLAHLRDLLEDPALLSAF
jgi:pyruvate dehydrogenase E2 component (dihydrolipoamide acetyltransferase)